MFFFNILKELWPQHQAKGIFGLVLWATSGDQIQDRTLHRIKRERGGGSSLVEPLVSIGIFNVVYFACCGSVTYNPLLY